MLSSVSSPTWFPQNKVLLGQCFSSFNVLKKSFGVMGRSPDFEIPLLSCWCRQSGGGPRNLLSKGTLGNSVGLCLWAIFWEQSPSNILSCQVDILGLNTGTWGELSEASWERGIYEWHGCISKVKDMWGATRWCLVWSIWEWKPNTIPCGTQRGLSVGWLEAHTPDQHATWSICGHFACLKSE